MKILYPIGSFYPSQQGGPSNTVYWMAKALVQKGVDVTIVTTNNGAGNKVAVNKWMDTNYGRVIYFSNRFPLFPRRMLVATISEIPHCDLVHLTSLFYPPSLIFAVVALWYNKPIVWSPRGELDSKALIYNIWRKRPFLWFIRQFLSKKVVFHSTSPEESLRVNAILNQKGKVVEIPNFLELPFLVSSNPSSPSYLLCIGRIHPKKAIENLITALQYSPKFLKSGINLVIAGDNNNLYGEQLKKQVHQLGLSKNVQFIGHIEGNAKQELYANAWFSILPSHTENFGNVVVESLAQGTPVIASTGTPWAILEQEQAGFWVDNSPIALAATIEEALNLSSEKYQHFRNCSLSIARQHFDIKENVGRWISVYQNSIVSHFKK